MRWFVGQAAFGGRVCASNQYYKSKISDDIFNIIKKELNLDEKTNVYVIIEAYLIYKIDHLKNIKPEFESKFDDYTDINEEEMKEHINKKLSELPIHQLLQQLSLVDLMSNFDCVSFYPSAMWDPKSIYPRIETGYAFAKDMNDALVEKFNNQTFTQGSATLRVKYCNPKNLIVQHLPVKEKVNKIEVNRMRNGYNIQILTSVDIQEIVKIGGKIVKIYEGVIYRENFKVNRFEKVINKWFELRQKYKDDNNHIMQILVKLVMNSLYGEFLRKDILESYQCKSEIWMMAQYDKTLLDYQKINHGSYIVKMKDDEGLEDEIKKANTLPLQLAVFILSNSKRIMNNFIHAFDGFYNNDVYYTDTDSLYFESKRWEKLDKVGLVGKNLLQGNNDYKDGGIWYGLFFAPKTKYCLTKNKYGVVEEHKTFKGFNCVSDNLDRKEYLNMADGDKLIAKVPFSWENHLVKEL